MTAPKTQKKKLVDLCEVLDDLEKLLQERISENNTTAARQGIMHKQHTHTHMYYRSLVWKAQELAGSI